MSHQCVYGIHAVREVLRAHPHRVERLLLLETTSRNKRRDELAALALHAGVPCQKAVRAALDREAGVESHQGVVAWVASGGALTLAECLQSIAGRPKATLAFLDGVTDPGNLGAILRSAEVFGVEAVVVPKNRAAKLSAQVRKAAAGAAERLPLIVVTNLSRALDEVRKAGFWAVGLDPHGGVPLDRCRWRSSTAVVLGGEGKGIRPGVAAHCDAWACVPQKGQTQSLNVSAAAAVVFYEISRQRET